MNKLEWKQERTWILDRWRKTWRISGRLW